MSERERERKREGEREGGGKSTKFTGEVHV